MVQVPARIRPVRPHPARRGGGPRGRLVSAEVAGAGGIPGVWCGSTRGRNFGRRGGGAPRQRNRLLGGVEVNGFAAGEREQALEARFDGELAEGDRPEVELLLRAESW